VLNVLETGVISSQHQTERLDAATQGAPTDRGDKRAVVFPSGVLLQVKKPKTFVANKRYHVTVATKMCVKLMKTGEEYGEYTALNTSEIITLYWPTNALNCIKLKG